MKLVFAAFAALATTNIVTADDYVFQIPPVPDYTAMGPNDNIVLGDPASQVCQPGILANGQECKKFKIYLDTGGFGSDLRECPAFTEDFEGPEFVNNQFGFIEVDEFTLLGNTESPYPMDMTIGGGFGGIVQNQFTDPGGLDNAYKQNFQGPVFGPTSLSYLTFEAKSMEGFGIYVNLLPGTGAGAGLDSTIKIYCDDELAYVFKLEFGTEFSGFIGLLSYKPIEKVVFVRDVDESRDELSEVAEFDDVKYVPWCSPGLESIHAFGDPHFQKWDGEFFDFHGECDLVFLQEPEFHHGLGLNIHIRTTARYEYSFIESAAIKIGDDILQVGSYGEYSFNGILAADLKDAKFADLFTITREEISKKKSKFSIDLLDGQIIEVSAFKDLVGVRVVGGANASLEKSRGIMGTYPEGKMLARDGKTLMLDPIEFGMEWQVQADEPMLFQVAREPQLPTAQCRMPTKTASAARRRLGERVEKEAAEAVCAAVDHIHHDSCVYDVMATGDLEVAHAGVF